MADTPTQTVEEQIATLQSQLAQVLAAQSAAATGVLAPVKPFPEGETPNAPGEYDGAGRFVFEDGHYDNGIWQKDDIQTADVRSVVAGYEARIAALEAAVGTKVPQVVTVEAPAVATPPAAPTF
jgi:hypothetical protein